MSILSNNTAKSFALKQAKNPDDLRIWGFQSGTLIRATPSQVNSIDEIVEFARSDATYASNSCGLKMLFIYNIHTDEIKGSFYVESISKHQLAQEEELFRLYMSDKFVRLEEIYDNMVNSSNTSIVLDIVPLDLNNPMIRIRLSVGKFAVFPREILGKR